MNIQEWLETTKMQYSWLSGNTLSIDDKKYLVLEERDPIIHSDYTLIFSEEEDKLLDEVDFVVFKFGNNWYFSSSIEPKLNPFRHIGKSSDSELNKFPYLGIHGRYELLNGSRDYKDWCKKAKFLGYETLGICEEQTLGGTLLFQEACKEAGIKSIIGQQSIVKNKNEFYKIKLFVKNQTGWRNLLKINKIQLVDRPENPYIEEEELFEHSEGLVAVITPETILSKERIQAFKAYFEDHVFYQFDLTEWKSSRRDEEYCNQIQEYLYNWLGELSPTLLSDSYYLDQIDHPIKKQLNKIGNIKFQNQSQFQHMKSSDDFLMEFAELMGEEEALMFFELCVDNTKTIDLLCQYEIPIGTLKLPKYELTLEQTQLYSDTEGLFWREIERGINDKIIPDNKKNKDIQKYCDRIDQEYSVLLKGKFIDYFLILWDIVNWSIEQRIKVGIGRGSAGGSLIAYLLGITSIDPIQYGLLFERFLNESRITKGLPDIDLDFAGNRRHEVKRYIEQRYGEDRVASIGTYTTLKIKAALQSLTKQFGASPKQVVYMSAILSADDLTYSDFFIDAVSNERLKDFVQSFAKAISLIELCLNQPKSSSIHAAGVIITPTENEYGETNLTIFDWLPVKLQDGVLVTEWEGVVLDKLGFLKEDILGIRQLDKFDMIFSLIEERYNEVIKIEQVSLDDPKVFEMFQRGQNGDVFHFGSQGLTTYSTELLPENIEDLIAMIALYRPGAMDMGTHIKYVQAKNGLIAPKYDPLLENVTKSTYSFYIYQEQVIQAVQILGKFSLSEADDVRKAMGKKNQELIDTYRDKFILGAASQGLSRDESIEVWEKLEAFARYGFNRSHAVAYAITGYVCQWLKVHYPLEFWTSALHFASEDDAKLLLIEIKSSSPKISIKFPDINHSTETFHSNVETQSIYYNLNSIKGVGPVSVKNILIERATNGHFKDFKDFISRINKSKVNASVILKLIFAGAMDSLIKDFRSELDRIQLLEEYSIAFDTPIENIINVNSLLTRVTWLFKQYNLTGINNFNFKKLTKLQKYEDASKIFDLEKTNTFLSTGGIVTDIIEKKTKKGDSFAQIILEGEGVAFEVTVWSETWIHLKQEIDEQFGKCILFLSGKVVFDTWRKKNVIHTTRYSEYQIIRCGE
jgi:DNA polymerase III subunit alpha